ncbi:MAG: prepilin peptidase [Deltaproteobacteria bacterium]|nr:prepilin peptidase [Deltaproteobacteria bacterium]MBW2364074.1 prepilin peptidase [Deltaproteobacteria bacterium]
MYFLSENVIHITIFIYGLCVGSFSNVCIYRLPLSKSLKSPPSNCPHCSSPIRFYDNIPLVSYILLKGKCRQCQKRISFRYPFVEMLGGVFALFIYLKYGFTLEALVYYTFIICLVIITFIDIDHQIIPDIISLPGIPIGFLASFALPSITFIDSLIGILAGGGSLFIVLWAYHLITGIEGMGGGDVKLLAMIGAIVGWEGVILTIFISSITGTIVGLFIMLRTKKGLKLAVPFGPFLSTGAILYVFYGSELIQWYFNI